MSKEIKEWMKEWSDLVNKETNNDDFWIETPVGNFKNPKFIPNENDEIDDGEDDYYNALLLKLDSKGYVRWDKEKDKLVIITQRDIDEWR